MGNENKNFVAEEQKTAEAPREIDGVTDYRSYVRDTVERQIAKYEKTKLETCSPQEIFNDAFECNAYVMIADALLDDNVEDEVYEALANEGDDILDNLYSEYVDTPDASIRSNEDTLAFLREYCQSEYPEIMNSHLNDLTM